MKLQVSTRLAIFALLHLAGRPDEQLSVSDIGDKYGISSHHLAKVMHALGRAGLVRAVRGARGGYQFSGNASRTTLLDVVQLFEDWASPHAISGIDGRTNEAWALSKVVAEIDEIAQATLGSITIATMLKLIDRRRHEQKRST
ncbi:MAG: Rrf2 family transcriptional regulator [Bradyrhizobiaceae bacterium]|nr:Rrf2 family transcriptional regulator [Bradyrhizobiaceae bacterium]